MMVQPEVWTSMSKRVEEEDEMDAFVKLFLGLSDSIDFSIIAIVILLSR